MTEKIPTHFASERRGRYPRTCTCTHCYKAEHSNNFVDNAVRLARIAKEVSSEPRFGDEISDDALQQCANRRARKDWPHMGQFLFFPLRSVLKNASKFEILSEGFLRPGVTRAQVDSRHRRFVAILHATLADEGVCPKCVPICAYEPAEIYLSWPGDDTRLYCGGGFFSPDGRTFGEWAEELRAQGHDLSHDPRFQDKWLGLK